MAFRGISEMKRHFHREHHLQVDQNNCERYFPEDVRGRVLYDERREKAKEFYIEYEVPEPDSKRPFYFDVIDGKPFTFTTDRDRVSMHIQLMMTFWKRVMNFGVWRITALKLLY